MENELIGVEQFRVDYETPKEIKISNYQQMIAILDKGLEKYSNMIITADKVKEAKKIRADLNRLKKELDNRRKEIKKDYQIPLKQFEANVKTMTSKIDDVSSKIDSNVKELERQEKEFKRQEVNDLLKEMCVSYKISFDEVEFQESWLNKSLSHKKLVEAIAGELKAISTAREIKKAHIQTVSILCEQLEISPEPYLNMVGQEQDPSQESLEKITNLIKENKKLADKRIEEKKRQAEYLKAIFEAEQEKKRAEEAERKNLRQRGDGVYNVDTGELVDVETSLVNLNLHIRVPASETGHVFKLIKLALKNIKEDSTFPEKVESILETEQD